MPRMNGRELIARLLRQNPRLRILLTSGSEQTLSETDARNVAFLGKPFTREALASQVRALLDLSPA